jgi:hypothetical protein
MHRSDIKIINEGESLAMHFVNDIDHISLSPTSCLGASCMNKRKENRKANKHKPPGLGGDQPPPDLSRETKLHNPNGWDRPNLHWFTSERDKKHFIALKRLRGNYNWEEPMKFFQRNQLSLKEKTRASQREAAN